MEFSNLKIGSLVLLKNGMYAEIHERKQIQDVIYYMVCDITSTKDLFPANMEYIEKDITIMDKETFVKLPLCYNTAKLFAYYRHISEGSDNDYIKMFWVHAVAYVIITLDENHISGTMHNVYEEICKVLPETLRLF
jgi:hypothetical protein